MMKMSQELKCKDIPISDEYPVVPPDMNYRYFENAKYIPIQVKEVDYSPVNAWWFSECSFLSYAHPGFARMAYLLAGFENFKHFYNDYINCMIVWDEDCIIVTFRGSELNNISALHNFNSNMDIKPVTCDQGGRVHQGFFKALNKVWEKPIGVKSFLDQLLEENPQRNLWFTGHSLGGALAGIAFSLYPKSFGLYTFGSPRFGDEEFVTDLTKRPVWRIVNYDDPIPLLPPDLPKIKFNFKHSGSLIYLRDDGKVIINKEEFDLTNQTRIAKKTILGQFRRFGRISRKFKKLKRHSSIFSRINIFRKNTKVAYSQISENVSLSFSEWKDYANNFSDLTSIKVENHMPIYYCCKLWNTMVEMRNEGAQKNMENKSNINRM